MFLDVWLENHQNYARLGLNESSGSSGLTFLWYSSSLFQYVARSCSVHSATPQESLDVCMLQLRRLRPAWRRSVWIVVRTNSRKASSWIYKHPRRHRKYSQQQQQRLHSFTHPLSHSLRSSNRLSLIMKYSYVFSAVAAFAEVGAQDIDFA